jgi:hypothetical protein
LVGALKHRIDELKCKDLWDEDEMLKHIEKKDKQLEKKSLKLNTVEPMLLGKDEKYERES